MEKIEEQCLNRLNSILSKFNLQIVSIKINRLKVCQYRLIYNNSNINWIDAWISISDILINHTSIFNTLKSYYNTTSNPSFNNFNLYKDTLSRFQDCSAAYKEILPLKTSSFEEFLIKCDLMGV